MARQIGVKEAKAYSVATFYENFSFEAKGKYVIKVCAGTGCIATGSQKIYETLLAIAKDAPGVTLEFQPCTAKKMEAKRPNSFTKGEQDTDIVITTTELIRMIHNSGIDFAELDPEASDVPFGFGSGGGVIFGVTGGVTEAVLRRLIPEHNKVALDAIAESGVRGDGAIKEFSFPYEGTELKICVVSGLANARAVMERVKRGEAQYHLIEVMACRRGCIMGGGQPPFAGIRTKAARAHIECAPTTGTGGGCV